MIRVQKPAGNSPNSLRLPLPDKNLAKGERQKNSVTKTTHQRRKELIDRGEYIKQPDLSSVRWFNFGKPAHDRMEHYYGQKCCILAKELNDQIIVSP